MLSQEEIEYYHSIGKMPDWIYYQTNGKTAQQNYNYQKNIRNRKFLEALNNSEGIDLEKEVELVLDNVLDNLFDDFLK